MIIGVLFCLQWFQMPLRGAALTLHRLLVVMEVVLYKYCNAMVVLVDSCNIIIMILGDVKENKQYNTVQLFF